MKVITLLLLTLFCLNISYAQKKQYESHKSGRIEKLINSQWTFNYFSSETADKGYESPGFNDTRWPAISLPHTWNSYETTGELHPFTRSPAETGETYWWTGWGWYRKHFSISKEYFGGKVFIEFEGVQKYCKVWINGKFVGDHKGGFGSFDFDITGYLKPGEDNVLAVAVNNIQKDEFRVHPLTEGSLNVSCGICRDVILVIKNKLFIPMQGSANHEGGTFITTPGVSEKEGIVNVKTWVKNDYSESKTCILQTSITDQNNEIIQVIKTEGVIKAGQLYMFDQTGKPLKNPHLWSIEDPYLYTVYSEIIDKKEVADTYRSSMGFRWFRFNEKDNSIYLDDKKIELKGVNRHQEYPWLGDAVPKWITEMDYSGISGKMGYNFVRTINYPGDEISYEQSDKYGIITVEDFSAIIKHGFSDEEQNQQIKEMIRRDRNHPCIISWSVEDNSDNSENVKFILSEDTTRLIKPIHTNIDSTSTCFVYNDIKSESDSNSYSVRERIPAKIILTGSHNKIGADRGSVAIIMADIVDLKGNPVPGAKNAIRWKVSGPATLVGPAYYVSYADSNLHSTDRWYREMPVTNIIRSNGKQGKIKVSVFSSGLASGSFEVDAEEISTDNSIIIEPRLRDEGRKPVTGSALASERLEEIPQEISVIYNDLNLAPPDKKSFTATIRDYIKKNNPLADTLSIEFKTLENLFASQLINNGGLLTAADYNYNVEQYNSCRLISGYITKTKLPPLFKESLRKYYSRLIIMNGIEKNAGDEMNWLNWIPSGGVVVIVPDERTSTSQKGVIFTKHTELPDIIKAVYPQFSRFSEDARVRALIFISKMNPSVHVSFRSETGGTANEEINNSLLYTVEKGQPILIPEYKFISE
jgi:hypothetical protein